MLDNLAAEPVCRPQASWGSDRDQILSTAAIETGDGQLGRGDQADAAHGHRMDHRVDLAPPEVEETVDAGKVRRLVQRLP